MPKVRLKSIMLGRLAAFVRTIPNSKLDMSTFCGTPRCLLGWAPSVPQLHEWGLRYGAEDGPYLTKARLRMEYDAGRLDRFRYKFEYYHGTERWSDKQLVVKWFYDHIKNDDSFMAGALAFGLERRDAAYLFGARRGFTPVQLADDLVKWTARKKKELANA